MKLHLKFLDADDDPDLHQKVCFVCHNNPLGNACTEDTWTDVYFYLCKRGYVFTSVCCLCDC